MASGDLTASTPSLVTSVAGLKTAIDALNLAAETDRLVVIPVSNVTGNFIVFKVEREV